MRSQVDSYSSTQVRPEKVRSRSEDDAPGRFAAGRAASLSEHPDREAVGGSPFNLPVAESCGRPVTELTTLEVAACRCGSQACYACGVAIAYKDARRVTEIVQGMQHPMMLTLTVDPEWGSPREVFDCLAKKRAIGEFMRSLRKKGYITGAWYRVSEFQMGRRPGSTKTEQVHFHILVDACSNFVPHDYMMQRWHQLARLCFGPPKPGREDYGFVQFERITGEKRANVAFYVCKYIAESAQKGLPNWYVDRANEIGPHGAKFNVMLRSHSRGFFGSPERPKPEHDRGGWCEPDGPTERCKEMPRACGRKPMLSPRRKRRTLRERLFNCKQKGMLLARVFELTASGEILAEHCIWLGEIPSYAVAFFICFGHGSEEQEEAWHLAYGRGRFALTAKHVEALEAQGLLGRCAVAKTSWVNAARTELAHV